MKKAVTRLVLLSLFFVPTVGFAVSVSPGYQIFQLGTDEAGKGSVEIANESETPRFVSAKVGDWFLLTENSSATASTWLFIEKPEFKLKPGEKKKVTFTVEPPVGVSGELGGKISFDVSENKKSQIRQLFSVSVYAFITGTEKPNVVVENIGVSASTSSVRVSVNLHNKGNIHCRPEGKALLLKEGETEPLTIIIREGMPMFPGESRSYNGQDKGATLVPGRYTLKLLINNKDNPGETISKEAVFRLTNTLTAEWEK